MLLKYLLPWNRRLLKMIIENFDGGPVGVKSIAAALSEEAGTVEDVLEPYLIQQGFLMRTPRGRMATRLAYQHFGLPPKESAMGQSEMTRDIFDD